jgi:hypothetical protein
VGLASPIVGAELVDVVVFGAILLRPTFGLLTVEEVIVGETVGLGIPRISGFVFESGLSFWSWELSYRVDESAVAPVELVLEDTVLTACALRELRMF